MLPYAIIPIMALAGFLGAPWWIILLGAAGVASEGWWMKAQKLRQRWSKKTTAFFVTGILINVALSAVSYGLGRLLHAAAVS